jgi:ankyrin repeat protein
MLTVSTSLAKTIAEIGRDCRNGQAKACTELTKIVTSAKNPTDRLAAVPFVSDTSVLSAIAGDASQSPEVSQAARARLDLLNRQAQAQAQAHAQTELNSDFRDAIRKGDIEKMKALAGRGADVNLKGRTYRDVVDLQQVAGGFRYRFKEAQGGSLPMLDAIASARVEVVRTLIALGSDVKNDFVDKDAEVNITSPINPDAMYRSFSLGMAFSITDGSGRGISFDGNVVSCSVRPTPARRATYLGVAKQLLAEASDGQRREGLQQIADLLAERAADAGEIHVAAKAGDASRIANLLTTNPRLVAEKDNTGATPLHYAAQYGRKNAVEVLLANKAEVNARENLGFSPLHEAVLGGFGDVVDLLLANGANPNATDVKMATPLLYAALKGNADVAAMLISKGADVKAASNDGIRPLELASQSGNASLVEALLVAGAEINATDNQGVTALHYASGAGQVAVVRVLLLHKAQVNARAGSKRDGATPLVSAAIQGRKEVAALLLSNGADVDAKDSFGRTSLNQAAEKGYADLAELLLANKADVEARDSQTGSTPLILASFQGHKTIVDSLLAHGANVNATGQNGVTALLFAAETGHRDIAEVLIAHGADVNARSTNGTTLLSVARQSGHADIVDLLRHHGGK